MPANDDQAKDMREFLLAICASLALIASPAHAADKKESGQIPESAKAGGAAAVGAAAGGAVFGVVGSGGLAIAGTALTIGAAPFVAAGAVLGLAGYGVYRAVKDDAPAPPPAQAKKKP